MKTHYSPSKVKPPTPDIKPPSYVHHVDTLLSVRVARTSQFGKRTNLRSGKALWGSRIFVVKFSFVPKMLEMWIRFHPRFSLLKLLFLFKWLCPLTLVVKLRAGLATGSKPTSLKVCCHFVKFEPVHLGMDLNSRNQSWRDPFEHAREN